jgi:hypothetical protein
MMARVLARRIQHLVQIHFQYPSLLSISHLGRKRDSPICSHALILRVELDSKNHGKTGVHSKTVLPGPLSQSQELAEQQPYMMVLSHISDLDDRLC